MNLDCARVWGELGVTTSSKQSYLNSLILLYFVISIAWIEKAIHIAGGGVLLCLSKQSLQCYVSLYEGTASDL